METQPQYKPSISASAGRFGGPVAIVGCGIAGPALALALRHTGFAPMIFEAQPGPRDHDGIFLSLAPNGVNALDPVGARQGVLAAGMASLGIDLFNHRGRLLGAIDGSDHLARFGAPTLVIRRGDLVREIRAEALRQGIRIEYGKRLASIQQTPNYVTATFEDGTGIQTPLLIACDGIRSAARQALFPCAQPPRYTGLLNAGGIARDIDLPAGNRRMKMYFGRQAFFGYFVGPRGEVYWFSNCSLRDEAEARRHCAALDPDGLRKWLLEIHAGDPPEIHDILWSTSNEIGCWPSYELPPMASWHKGRVCLIGDAAHASSPHIGQGASLALEDAICLAGCLAAEPDPSYAFATFQTRRWRRVERLVAEATRTGRQKARSNAASRWIRDLLLPIFIRRSARSLDWVYSHQEPFERREVPVPAEVGSLVGP
jgi:FAD-dependent urate hydroxylase